MREQNNGGPAFPVFPPENHASVAVGMTLRDYFAAHAPDHVTNIDEWGVKDAAALIGVSVVDYSWQEHSALVIAARAYAYADAMLKARLQ